MRRLTLIAALATLVLAGCGGSDEKSSSGSSSSSSSSSGGGGEVVKLSADKSALKFDPSTLKAKAGKVTLEMANPSGIDHAVSIKGGGSMRTATRSARTARPRSPPTSRPASTPSSAPSTATRRRA